jgi:hypothetical protein
MFWFAIAAAVIAAKASKNQSDAAAKVAQKNAQLNTTNSLIAADQAAAEESRFRDNYKRFQGKQGVAQAKSGFEASGSYQDVMADSASQAELDALTIRYQGKIKSMGFEQQAEINNFEAKTIKKNAPLNMVSSALGGYAAGKSAFS